MTLAELAEVLDLPPRQVRYLIAEAVIPPALTLGRGGNAFDASHVAAGEAFKALAAEGYGVRKAKAVLDARAQVSAMVVDLEVRGSRRHLRFGPLEVLVRGEDLAGLSDSQFEGILTAARDKLAALRAESINPAPMAAARVPRRVSRKASQR